MLKVFHCNMVDENCYVLSDDTTKECVIIDCGALYEDERDAIVNYIKANGLKPVHLLCTHGHFDHIFGNAAMHEAFGLSAEVHFEDADMLRNLDGQIERFFRTKLSIPSGPIGKLLTTGESINYGTQTLEVIYTPGHSRGGVVFYNKAEQIAFTGDTLFQMSIGRTDLEGGDYETLLSSIHLLANTLSPETKIYPGHGPASTMQYEISYNPYLR